jgi:hypothetical protein
VVLVSGSVAITQPTEKWPEHGAIHLQYSLISGMWSYQAAKLARRDDGSGDGASAIEGASDQKQHHDEASVFVAK